MKIAVVSDTHGHEGAILRVIRLAADADCFIHLGDVVSDAQYIEAATGKPVYYVSGNCDTMRNADTERVITLDGQRIFMTHGHRYAPDYDRSRLFYRAEEEMCALALYGHTHISMIEASGSVIAMNPGSPSLPRGGRKASFGVIDIIGGKIDTRIITL